MKTSDKLYSVALASAALILFLFLVSSTASAAPYAYITNSGDNTVSIIDTVTDTVKEMVLVGKAPWGVAVNPAGTKVYVTNNDDGTVSVIDTSTNEVTYTVTVGAGPYGVAVNPAGTMVYVANSNDGTVSVIDTSTNNVTYTVTVGAGPYGVAVTPDGTKVYVTNNEDVSVIDTATNNVTATVNVRNRPYGVAVNPTGTKVYVASAGSTANAGIGSNTVSVIDTATNNVKTTKVPVGSSPFGVAVNPAGTKVYVANTGDDTVSVINTTTNEVTYTVTVGAGPYGVAVNPAGTKVYVVNSALSPTVYGPYSIGRGARLLTPGTVSVIDTATYEVTTVPVRQTPIAFGQFIGTLPDTTTALTSSPNPSIFGQLVTLTANVSTTSPGAGTPSGTVTFFDGNTSIQTVDISSGQATLTTSSLLGGPRLITAKYNGDNNFKSSTSTALTQAVSEQPVAHFTSNFTNNITAPVCVQFNDTSTDSPTEWKWDFGDGDNSDQQNSTHTYSKAGNYTVSLTVFNAAGQNNSTSNTITVKESTLTWLINWLKVYWWLIVLLALIVYYIWTKSKNQKATAQVSSIHNATSLDVQIEPVSIPADGKSTATVTIKIKDDKGNFISSLNERTVELSTNLGTITSPVKISPGEQTVTATITSEQVSGTAKVVASSSPIEGEEKSLYGEGKVVFAELPKRYCMHCGATMTMDASSCPKCGEIPPSGVDTKQCSTCDAVLPQSAKFCDSCGARQPM